MNFSLAYVDMLSKLELCYVAVWGKSLLSTHMLVGSSNRNVEIFCGSNNSCVLAFLAHMISRKGKLSLLKIYPP